MAGGIGATLKSWTVKIFLGIIALSFAVWGIGDIFRGGQDPSVASVGGVKIHASQLSRAYSREVERLRVASNGAIDAEQARAMGVVQRTLQSMISRKVFDLETAGLGMTVDDATLRREIRDNPAFFSVVCRSPLRRNPFVVIEQLYPLSLNIFTTSGRFSVKVGSPPVNLTVLNCDAKKRAIYSYCLRVRKEGSARASVPRLPIRCPSL